jgi:hypothetical protein
MPPVGRAEPGKRCDQDFDFRIIRCGRIEDQPGC